jgi:serine protease
MKKALPTAVLLLLLLLVSGGALFLFADPAAHSADVTPASNAWAPITAALDQVGVPGVTGVKAPYEDKGGFYGLSTDPDRPTESFPPVHFEPWSGPLKPRPVTAKDFYLNLVDRSNTNRLIIKFTEESKIRWKDSAPYSKAGDSVQPLRSLLARHPEATLRREMIEIPEETLDSWEHTGEQNIGVDLANLNNFYVFDIKSNPDPRTLIEEFIQLDVVETAFYEPKAEPACADIAPTTPNWVANQTYHGAAPTGVNSDYAGTYYGTWGHGNPGAWTIDIEWDWTEDHEDFPSTFSVLDGGDGGNPADHGDACSGIIAACDNSYGMSGESPNITPKGISVNTRTCGQAVALAQGHLFVGESMFIEMHGYAVNPGYNCDNGCGNCGQFGYVAMEYWDDNFSAMQTATANGRVIFEAAGNGQCNLDATAYANRFNRNYRDSGAIVVGASHSNSQDAMCWSNYGSRVDCNGWGENVYTLGYGNLWSGGARNQYYTNSFSGTSSATPIVTASGNDLQGVMQGKYGVTATSTQIRSYLHDSGTPYTSTHAIGNKPNLVNAINWIEPDVQPYPRTGWSYAVVPRNTTGATGDACAITTALDGNTNDTYVNVCGINSGVTPAPDSGSAGVYSRVYLDGDWIYWVNWSGHIDGGQQFWYNNYGPLTVRGGRHTWEFSIDPDNAFNEYNDSNNDGYQQNVWSPMNWTAQSYAERSAPPLKSWGNPTYYNGDGFRSNPSGSTYWLGCAILPQSGNDVDLYSYADSYTNSSGFDVQQAYSGAGAGSPDMILVNGNVVSPMNRLFQAVRYSDASTSNYAIEIDQAATASWYPPYTTNKTLDANAVFDLFEIYLTAGTPYFIGATGVTGGLDLRLNIYGQGGDYYTIGTTAWSANNSGANGNEVLNITPTTSGWYVAAVLKQSSASYGVSGAYTFGFFANPVANLIPGAGHPGWDAPMVARNTNDAQQNNTPFPATITGNAISYLNSAWFNAGYAPVPSGYRVAARVDNNYVGGVSALAALSPQAFTESMPMAATTIRGGRHTLSFTLDSSNVVPESDETDNDWSGQYVWSPMSLTRGTPVQRIAPPLQGSGAYPNSDGFSFPNVGSYAIGAAILPRTATADYDLNLYSDYTGTFSGFSTLVIGSAYGSGVTDYVIVPWQIAGTHSSWYPGIINWNGAADSVVIQYDNALGREFMNYPFQLTNSDTIPVRGVFNMYEVYMTTGAQYTFFCDQLSGNADLDMRLHIDTSAYQYRGSILAIANTTGPGGDETLQYIPTVSAWYVLVVSKTISADATQTAIYNLTGSRQAGSHTPLPVMNLVLQPYTSANSVKLAWNHVTQDSLGSPLTRRRYVIYRNSSIGIVPLPADSIGGTTDSTFVDFGATGSMNFYRVTVKAQ